MKVVIEPFEKIWAKNFNFKFLGPLHVYIEASYPAVRVTRQRRDPGCNIKVLFFGSLLIWNKRV